MSFGKTLFESVFWKDTFRKCLLERHFSKVSFGKTLFESVFQRNTFKKGKSMFGEVNLKINGKWVHRVGIRVVSTFDQKIFVFEEPKDNFIK